MYEGDLDGIGSFSPLANLMTDLWRQTSGPGFNHQSEEICLKPLEETTVLGIVDTLFYYIFMPLMLVIKSCLASFKNENN